MELGARVYYYNDHSKVKTTILRYNSHSFIHRFRVKMLSTLELTLVCFVVIDMTIGIHPSDSEAYYESQVGRSGKIEDLCLNTRKPSNLPRFYSKILWAFLNIKEVKDNHQFNRRVLCHDQQQLQKYRRIIYDPNKVIDTSWKFKLQITWSNGIGIERDAMEANLVM